MRRAVAGLVALAAALACGEGAAAEQGGPIVVWPTLTPAGDDPAATPMHRPRETDTHLFARAQELDATIRDAVQDLGYTLDVADPGPALGHTRDTDLLDRAARGAPKMGAGDTPAKGERTSGTWVVSARLERETSDTYVVRLVAVPPNGRELRVRVESVKGADVPVRALVMLRDLLSPSVAAQAEANQAARERVDAAAGFGIMSPLHSPGRAVLAVNAALFGAYVAYSVQRASGNDDPRVLYPLLALGTGVGIGSALLVSDEWDVSTGDAWLLSAGAWWGAGAAVLIANGRHVQPMSDRYAWGIGGGLAGLGLGTFALTRGTMDEGDAMLVHSGAALGLALGGLGELAYRGTIDQVTPYTGSGYGTAIGLVGAGALAALVQVSPSRVLLLDLGAGIGGLAGAAAASPLLFGDTTEGRNRGFLAATLSGAIAGTTIAWFITRTPHSTPAPAPAPAAPSALRLVPTGGVIGASATPEGSVPAYGIGLRGRF
jgi:hypothetical protein